MFQVTGEKSPDFTGNPSRLVETLENDAARLKARLKHCQLNLCLWYVFPLCLQGGTITGLTGLV